MHFGTKSYLKSNRNHTAKQTLVEYHFYIVRDHWPELNCGLEKKKQNNFS
jgi:hypothetical protein